MCLCLGACIVKYILILVNLVLTLIGLAITALGVVVLVNLRSIDGAQSDDISIFPIVIIVVGCVITVIFFLGCCGAITKNTCMLISYTVIIVILACLTVAVTVILSKNTDPALEIASEKLTQLINETDSTVLSLLESSLECCGIDGPEWYANSSIPLTCCPEGISKAVSQNIDISSITNDINISQIKLCDIENAFHVGCVTKFIETMREVLTTTVTVLICVCISEYVAAGMAIFLTCYIKSKQSK